MGIHAETYRNLNIEFNLGLALSSSEQPAPGAIHTP